MAKSTKQKLYTAGGKTQTLSMWAKELGCKRQTLWARINGGIDVERALSKEFSPALRPRDESRTITKRCAGCGNSFTIPKCRDWREKACSTECKMKVRRDASAELRNERTRVCQHCRTEFFVKKSQIDSGCGVFCSHKCAYAGKTRHLLNTLEANRKSARSWMEGYKAGRIKVRSGADNPRWKGGPEAARRRLTESGTLARRLREYRKRNPDKVREWRDRRDKTKTGRLPAGTIKRIGNAQRWRCAICRVCVKGKYHADHIIPLALGGAHAPDNIQILCPSCNTRKSAKHPIDYMQERGFLL